MINTTSRTRPAQIAISIRFSNIVRSLSHRRQTPLLDRHAKESFAFAPNEQDFVAFEHLRPSLGRLDDPVFRRAVACVHSGPPRTAGCAPAGPALPPPPP